MMAEFHLAASVMDAGHDLLGQSYGSIVNVIGLFLTMTSQNESRESEFLTPGVWFHTV